MSTQQNGPRLSVGMRSKRSWIVGSLAMIAGIGLWQSQGQSQQTTGKEGLKPFMQRKLDHAKSILEGMALEDFDKISASAQSLSLLSLESTWNVISSEEYLEHSRNFRRSINLIKQAARDKNSDRVALGYIDLTIRCVECHSYLRKKGG